MSVDLGMGVKDAAAQLGLAEAAVYALLAARKLGCRKVGPSGGRYRITEAHIAAYLESCEVPVRGGPPPRAKAAAGRTAGRAERLDGLPPKHYL